MFTCTSTVHHGDCSLTATGEGATRRAALLAAIEATDVGYRPSDDNTQGGVELVERWERGDRPAGRYLDSMKGYAYLMDEPEGPRIQIGWVDFTFTERTVRMWAVQAQVSTLLERQGWSLSRQVPTFYLDPSVQGITGPEGARAVAEDILYTVAGDTERVQLHVTVEPLY